MRRCLRGRSRRASVRCSRKGEEWTCSCGRLHDRVVTMSGRLAILHKFAGALCAVVISHGCGGGAAEVTADSGKAAAGASALGAVGCATRSETYTRGVEFVFQYSSVIGYPDCAPTCGVPADSIQALPAGPCTTEPTCSMLAFWDCPTFCGNFDGGSLGASGFLCACVDTTAGRRWSCTIALP